MIFKDPKNTPDPVKVETKEERIERRRREKAEQIAYKLEREIAIWDPSKIVNTTDDPFKTLFVSRINYDTSESKLRREFEVYGPIKKVSGYFLYRFYYVFEMCYTLFTLFFNNFIYYFYFSKLNVQQIEYNFFLYNRLS